MAERRQQLADPPEWSSLGAHPGLQHAAQLLHGEFSRWASDARRPYLPPPRRELFDWHLIRDAAEETAAATDPATAASILRRVSAFSMA